MTIVLTYQFQTLLGIQNNTRKLFQLENNGLLRVRNVRVDTETWANFDDDIDNWKTSKPSPLILSPDSPDWIPPNIVLGDGFCPANSSFYVRSASKRESIMVELKKGYKLKKVILTNFKLNMTFQ